VPTNVATALAASRFPVEVLERAERRLAEHIGAVARVVVKRAAMKARDEAELYLLLADEIEDKNDRKAFIRKAVSVSGKP
jgi:serine/threonine-protein kinase